MNRDRILGALRHILTTVGGGWFVSRGIVEDAAAWEMVTSAAITLIGFVWSWVSPEKKYGAEINPPSLGCIAALFLAIPLLGGCAVTAADLQAVKASERPVGSALTLLGERDGFRDALLIWNTLAPPERTLEVEDSLLDAAAFAAVVAGGVVPVTTTGDAVRDACRRLNYSGAGCGA